MRRVFDIKEMRDDRGLEFSVKKRKKCLHSLTLNAIL